MRKSVAKIIVIFVFFIIFGCNLVKRVPKNELLLSKNVVLVNEKAEKSSAISNYILQHPNTRLGRFALGLSIFNLANPKSEENYQKWLERHPKIHRFLTHILSEKQVHRLGESFIIGGKDRMLMDLGEAPVLLDTALTHKSMKTLIAYYRSNGYFNATGRYDIDPIMDKKQQVSVAYNITTGEPYFIDSLSQKIASPELDSVYHQHISQRIIKKGQQYSLNNFANERLRLNSLFRNNGFYTFQESAISFEIQRDTTSVNADQMLSVETQIDDYTDRSGNFPVKKPYQIHKLGQIHLYTDYDVNRTEPYDTIQYKDLTIHFDKKLRFKPKTLYNSISLRKDEIYSDNNRSTTYRQLSNLRMFRYPNIQYAYPKNDTLKRVLDASIMLNPLTRYSAEWNTELTHSEIQAFGIGLGTSLLNRNIFRGAEILEIGFRGTIGSQQLLTDARFFNIFEYGGDIRFTIPRIWFFINTEKIIPYSMTPQTLLQVSTTYQKNIGIDRNKLQGIFRYQWNPTLKNKAIFDLIDAEYIKNSNPDNYFNVYESSYNRLNDIARNHNLTDLFFVDSNQNLLKPDGAYRFGLASLFGLFPSQTPTEYAQIQSIMERYLRLTNNDFVLANSFSYIVNNSSQYFQPDFQQIKGKIEVAGTIPMIIAKMTDMPINQEGERQFFGVSYAQYVKTEVEFIKHWNLQNENVLAFRAFTGVAIPFGNRKTIPFTRSYFAGGANDNRGWRAYSLGPGNSGSRLDFNEANFKFALNLEYRFPIVSAFKGALFADAGNIWNIANGNRESSETLDKWTDIEDIALATGFGIRYDFDYFVLRLDVGFKTYDPAKDQGNRWFKQVKFNEAVLNIGINYPF